MTTQWWTLDMADRAGRWEQTPFRASLLVLLDQLADSFPWILADVG